MASRDVTTLDRPALENFRTALVAAGFEPQAGDLTVWVGPIAESLKRLTSAPTMKLVFVDGWPFRPPQLYVQGLDEWHVSADGQVCLWTVGAVSAEWLTVDGYVRRIDQWVQRVTKGFDPEDFALDAHLSFERRRIGAIATIDIGSLGLDGKVGEIGTASATWDADGAILAIRCGDKGVIQGRWYYAADVRTPPRNILGVRALLNTNQQRNFDRRFRAIEKHGTQRLFVIAWDREFGCRELLVLLAEKREAAVEAVAIEVAPTDHAVLKLRAGPDTTALADKRVVVFGLGAVGSHAALRLAESGVGSLVLVDGGQLRPGDVVRHAVSPWGIGGYKVIVVAVLIKNRAPWTEVHPLTNSWWDPENIAKTLRDADLVVDATGFASFATLLSVMCLDRSLPLLSASLFRDGFVGRVRRQALSSDTPFFERAPSDHYPQIPPGNEPIVFEPGCSAPVNNASPIAVNAIATLTADLAVDHLTGRNLYTDEVIHVFRPLDSAPFDKLGRLTP